MNTTEIKTELQRLIEEETDIKVLKALKTILEKTNFDPVLRKKLTNRALKAEEDISNDRVFTKEQMVDQIDSFLDK